MSDKWVHDLFEEFQAKHEAEQQRRQWDDKARASYDAFFDDLKSRVAKDVATYNQLFEQHKSRKVDYYPQHPPNESGSFSVSCSGTGKNVLVEKTRSSVIKIYRNISPGLAPEKSDTLEVVADGQGAVRYKHGKDILDDASVASEVILRLLLFLVLAPVAVGHRQLPNMIGDASGHRGIVV